MEIAGKGSGRGRERLVMYHLSVEEKPLLTG